MRFDPSKLADFPVSPGIYLMKNSKGMILYIGKAKNLRQRLRQYFTEGGDGRWIIPFLQQQVVDIETVVTASEKEALLLENNFIKQHKPRYNALLKDDKSFIAVQVNIKHPWPKLSIVRYKGAPPTRSLVFGPYSSAFNARKTIDFIQRLFPLRQCSDEELARRTRPCILYDMKRCCAPCVGKVDSDAYQTFLEGALRFLKGKGQDVMNLLKDQREKASSLLEFEKAAEIHQMIESIEKTLEKQTVDQTTGKVSADLLGIYREGEQVALSRLIFLEGRLQGYKHYIFERVLESDEELIERFLLQSYDEGREKPPLVCLPFPLTNKGLLEEVLQMSLEYPQKGAKAQLLKMAYANAEAVFKQKKDQKQILENSLDELEEKCHLSRFPEVIECYDTSHLGGAEGVSVKVVFRNGLPDKAHYRKYKLKTAASGDDYGALREVLSRRFDPSKEEVFPDLILIDGGKAHLNQAQAILKELNIASVDLLSMAKEEGRHDKGMSQERLFRLGAKEPVILPLRSSLLYFLQQVRDEAHRFALTFQKKKRTKSLLKSDLDQIVGLGPVKIKALLSHFGSLKRVKEASLEGLQEVKSLNANDINNILNYFK